MKITLCGSIAFIDEMDAVRRELESMGHEVQMPPLEIVDGDGKMIPVKEYYAIRKAASDDHAWIWNRKAEAMRWHFDKIVWSDVILVCNYDKNGVANYIGANTLLEMGLAFHLKKPIYLLNSIPEISYKEEILGMWPIVIDGNLEKIV
jgi:hypothetical protein